jgi:hypothetical protein
MALKAAGIMIHLGTKLLIVGDSVMGCFSKRRGIVTDLPAPFHILVIALGVRVIRRSRDTLIRAGSFAGLFLPATRLVLPWAICKLRGIDGRGSYLSSAMKLRNVLGCQAKIFEAVVDPSGCRAVAIIIIIIRLFSPPLICLHPPLQLSA